MAGIARAHARAAEVGIRLVVGCRLDLRDGLPVLVYPLDRAGYGRLCQLLTLGKGRTGKGGCDIAWSDLAAAGEGLLLILLPDQPDDRLDGELRRMRGAFAGRCHLALWAIRGLADTVLPMFAAAYGKGRPQPELVEPVVPLAPMGEGREVVEDYRSVGLTLGHHPVAFLRAELRARGMVGCGDLLHLRDGRRVVVPGIVRVRQKPGSAKGSCSSPSRTRPGWRTWCCGRIASKRSGGWCCRRG